MLPTGAKRRDPVPPDRSPGSARDTSLMVGGASGFARQAFEKHLPETVDKIPHGYPALRRSRHGLMGQEWAARPHDGARIENWSPMYLTLYPNGPPLLIWHTYTCINTIRDHSASHGVIFPLPSKCGVCNRPGHPPGGYAFPDLKSFESMPMAALPRSGLSRYARASNLTARQRIAGDGLMPTR